MIRIISIFFIICPVLFAQDIPFHRGVNLTNWFQSSEPGQIQFTKYTRQDFINIKSLGCDVIRLPVNLHAMTSGAPDYSPDPLFLYMLDQVVDWAEELQMNLIIDNHSFDPAVSTDPEIRNILIPVWKNMAAHYKNKSRYIFYEILNEPHGISDAAWNAIQAEVVDSIRTIDTVHTIVVGPANWNSYSNLNAMPEYGDGNLIYTFHFYDPFLLTHQGATWTDPSMASLAGIPFPYDADRMPDCPADLIGTWIESEINNYPSKGTTDYVNNLIQIAAAFKTSRNVPVYCGEFGVYKPNSYDEDRVYWYETVRMALESNDIGWTIWDYQGGFGLFESGTDELFDYDLNIPLLEALDFNIPPQSSLIIKPDTSGIIIYDDFTGYGMVQGGWNTSGILNYYSEDTPSDGQFCIKWENADQYNNIAFDFQPDRDFSFLAENNFFLQLWLRGDNEDISFDARFIDTKTSDPNDHPWRIRYTIDRSLVNWDSNWHKIAIPLSDFSEQGSWDNETWYNPIGAFDWTAIDRFEFSAEEDTLYGRSIWIDNIAIVKEMKTFIAARMNKKNNFILFHNFPNPFNPSTTIAYYLPENTRIDISVFNILGEKIKGLYQGFMPEGSHTIIWNGDNFYNDRVASGIYILRFQSEYYMQERKMILLR